jgi:hypothetical protein
MPCLVAVITTEDRIHSFCPAHSAADIPVGARVAEADPFSVPKATELN